MYRYCLWSAAAALLLVWGCAAQREGTRSVSSLPVAGAAYIDSSQAMRYFISGATHDIYDEYADAILEYQEALRYDDRAAIYYCIANDYYKLRKTERAAQFADSAIARDPSGTLYRSLRAEIALTLEENFGEAQRQYEQIVALDSDDVQALSDLAGLYQLHTKSMYQEKAEALYKRILDIEGHDAEVSLHLAQLYNQMGDQENSVAALKNVLEDDPSNMELRETIAETYVQMNQTDSAIMAYTDLLERSPGVPGVEIALAGVYSSDNQWQKAFGYYTAALKNDSLTEDTVNIVLDSLYAHIYIDTASIGEIQPVIEKYAGKDSTNWFAHILLGGMQLYNRQNTQAYVSIRRAIAGTTDTTDALLFGMQVLIEHERYDDMFQLACDVNAAPDFRVPYLRAVAYERLKEYPQAVVELNASLRLNPHNWRGLSELGMDYDEMHNSEKSDSSYNASLAINPEYPVTLNNYSYSLAERGIDLEHAKEMCAKALALDSNNINYLDTYGWIFYKLGEYDSAAAYIQRAVNDTGAPATVIEHLGDVRYKLGQYKEALLLWNEALAKNESNDALKQKILENTRHEQ